MDTLPFIVSLGGNIAGVIAAVTAAVLAIKLAIARQERDDALDDIAEMKPDAERGRKNRVALDKANAIRRAGK